MSPLAVVSWIAASVFLLLVALAHSLGGNPFVTYTPPNYGLYVVAGLAYMFVAFALARWRWTIGVHVALCVAALVVFVGYHRSHAGTEIQVFKDYEPVTPFHVQLAPLLFITLGGALLISVAASSKLGRPCRSRPRRR